MERNRQGNRRERRKKWEKKTRKTVKERRRWQESEAVLHIALKGVLTALKTSASMGSRCKTHVK